MKVLQVTPTFFPSKFGGVRTLSYQCSNALAKRGHEVVVYTTDADIGCSRLRDFQGTKNLGGVSVRYFKNLSNLLAFKHRLFVPLGMPAAAKREVRSFDIIHLHDFRSFQIVVAYHYAKKYGVPYVVDAHGSTPRMAGGKKGFKWLLKWIFDIAFGYRILRDASKVIAETDVGVEEYRELGVKEDKIVLIAPPLAVEEFANLPPRGVFRKKYGIEAEHIVTFLGRINWIKGLDFLVESFAELARQRSDVVLAVVGPDDGYKPALERLIEKLNLSNRVLFTGFLGGVDKLSALVDADVVVQTSRYEQGAWAPFEAVLCGTPIIVSSNSGAGEDVRLIDAGYLVEWGNKVDLVDKIQYVLDNPDQASIKTQKAREYLQGNRSMSSRVREYEELYAACTSEKAGRP